MMALTTDRGSKGTAESRGARASTLARGLRALRLIGP